MSRRATDGESSEGGRHKGCRDAPSWSRRVTANIESLRVAADLESRRVTADLELRRVTADLESLRVTADRVDPGGALTPAAAVQWPTRTAMAPEPRKWSGAGGSDACALHD